MTFVQRLARVIAHGDKELAVVGLTDLMDRVRYWDDPDRMPPGPHE